VLRRILFEDPPLLSTRLGLPPELAALIARSLEKDPADRPADASAFVDALEAIALTPSAEGVRATVIEGTDTGIIRIACGSTMDIGKHPSATLALRDTAASRFHCEVTYADGALQVRDLGSNSGLTVDGERVTRARVRDGAVLGIGASRVRIDRVADAGDEADELERARRGDMNVLLEGDQWQPRAFAEALHNCGARRRALCVPVYGAALRVEDLAALSGGTLLVEEADSLSPEAQQALFQCVTTRTAPTPRGRVPSDVRMVTHAAVDLRAAVNAKRFRPDLFHVLAGIRLRTSPS
jgi:pSer/pThr/pTyr-binding forkhead associated (FHA) protein